MKLKGFILFIVLFLVIAGCKKTGSDGDLDVCGDTGHKHLENGTCVCDTGWFGLDCDQSNDTCGLHSHNVGNGCVCDSGWIGPNCDQSNDTCGLHSHSVANGCVCDSAWAGPDCSIAIGQFSGIYHVTGTSRSWDITGLDTTTALDELLEVTVYRNAVIAKQTEHIYYNPDSTRYLFGHNYPSPYASTISFHKAPDDSVFYYQVHSGLGSGYEIILKGIKQ